MCVGGGGGGGGVLPFKKLEVLVGDNKFDSQ